MMTTNKLTKTFAYGSLAIGVLAGSVFAATSASASGSPNDSTSLTWAQWTSGIPLVLPINGATATYGGGTFVPEEPNNDRVVLFKTGDEFEFTYSALPGVSPITQQSGSFTYNITFPTFVNGVAIDTDVTGTNYGTVTKTVNGITPVVVLNSVNGSADPLVGFQPINLTKTLTITDTLNRTGIAGEGLSTLSNNFQEAPHVPEPGTILGLLTVGGLGMVSRLKKQK